ncbi:hypothetical protein A4X03_0g9517 [Tilletia caries]|nr:hypothetical protein A4X03_0g9517 [Tilletia caries]
MQRNRRRRPRQLLNDAAIVELVEDVARLSLPRKAGKAGTTGPDAPGRDGDGEFGNLGDDLANVDAIASELLAEGRIIGSEGRSPSVVFGRNDVGCNPDLAHVFLHLALSAKPTKIGAIMDVLRILLAILLPPLGVFLQVGIGLHFWLNILLTLFGYIPGIIHAIWVIIRK